jgi:hypothetical protein
VRPCQRKCAQVLFPLIHGAIRKLSMLHYLEKTPAFHAFIRELELVSENPEGNWAMYQYYSARVDQVICLASFMWPEFTEREGLILRKPHIDWEQMIQEAKKANWSKMQTEYVFNHLHLYDIFSQDPDKSQVDNEVFTALAYVIADTWRCRLKELFPDRVFAVGVDNEETDPEVYAYEIVGSS